MEEIDGFSEEAYQIAEAVVIRNALSDYIVKTASTNANHEQPEYKTTIQFLSMIYKKYQRIAATPVTIENRKFVIRRDIRRDFDLN